jgi:hypothetical protein
MLTRWIFTCISRGRKIIFEIACQRSAKLLVIDFDVKCSCASATVVIPKVAMLISPRLDNVL